MPDEAPRGRIDPQKARELSEKWRACIQLEYQDCGDQLAALLASAETAEDIGTRALDILRRLHEDGTWYISAIELDGVNGADLEEEVKALLDEADR